MHDIIHKFSKKAYELLMYLFEYLIIIDVQYLCSLPIKNLYIYKIRVVWYLV